LSDECLLASSLEKFSASLTAGFESEYVFRGKSLAGASFNPEVDMAYDVGYGFGVYAGVWANTPVNSSIENEIDVYAGINYEIKNFTFDLGYIAYMYSGETSNSNEIKFAVAYDTVDYLGEFNVSPMLAYYYDFTLGVNTLEAGAAYSAPVTKWIADRNWGTIDLAAAYGWATTAHEGYSYVMLSADAVVAINSYAKISAGIRYSYNNDYTAADPTASRLWFGTALVIGF